MSDGADESNQGVHIQIWRSSVLLTEQANYDTCFASLRHRALQYYPISALAAAKKPTSVPHKHLADQLFMGRKVFFSQ